MFATHQKQIEEYAWHNPQHIVDVLAFARLTVRRQMPFAVRLAKKAWRVGVEAFPDEAGKKCYEQICEAAPFIWASGPSSESVFRKTLEISGFGMAKAGFVTQMLTGQLGCFDSHNLTRFNLKGGAFRIDAPWEVVEQRIKLYKALCNNLGSAYMWDSWCEYVAALYPKVYRDAEHLSEMHVEGVVR